MGFQSRAGKACSRCAKGSCTWVAGEDGCVQCKSKAKGCVDGEAPERWSWGSPVQDFPPSDHFGLGHLERGLRTLGFLSREADEGALGREYARLAWDLRQAWGVVRESPPFLYADGSVIARRSPVPLEGARSVGPAEATDLEAAGVQLALEASRQEGRRQELLAGQSAGAGSSRDVVPEVPREVVETRVPSLVPDVDTRVGTEVPSERDVETEVPLQEEELGTGVPPEKEAETEVPLQEEEVGTEVPPEKEVETEVPLQEEDGGAGVLPEKELEENPQVPLEEEEVDSAEDVVGWGGFASDAFSDGVTEDDELVAPVPLDVDRTGLEQERKLWFFCWLAGAYPPLQVYRH